MIYALLFQFVLLDKFYLFAHWKKNEKEEEINNNE